MFGFDWFQLDGHYLLGVSVDGVVDLTERPASDSLEELVVLAHHDLHTILFIMNHPITFKS